MKEANEWNKLLDKNLLFILLLGDIGTIDSSKKGRSIRDWLSGTCENYFRKENSIKHTATSILTLEELFSQGDPIRASVFLKHFR